MMFWNPAYVHLSKKAHCTVLISIGVPNDKMYTVNWQALFTPDPAGIFYNDVPGPCKIRDFLIVFSETPFPLTGAGPAEQQIHFPDPEPARHCRRPRFPHNGTGRCRWNITYTRFVHFLHWRHFMTDLDISAESQVPDVKLFPWWLLLLWGILTIIIGLMFLLSPAVTTVLFITFLGAYWLVGGLFMIGRLFVDRTNLGLKVLLAVINIFAGTLILLHPFFSTIFALAFLILFLGFWALFIGAVHLYHGFTAKDAGNSVLGVISIVFGILLLANSYIALVLLPFNAGGFCMISGLTTLYVSYIAKTA